MQTIWLSPTNFVTGDPTLRVSYPFVSHPSTIVSCTAPGDFKFRSVDRISIYSGGRSPCGLHYQLHYQ
jgi:hypothetical protein